MVFAKKKWGQNFLVDNNLLEKIIKTIDIKKDDDGHFYFVGQDRDILKFKYNVKVEDVITVEGMDPMILADIYGLTGNAKSKKRGRKTKSNTL